MGVETQEKSMKLNGRAVIYAVRISLCCTEAWNFFLLQELRDQGMWTGMFHIMSVAAVVIRPPG